MLTTHTTEKQNNHVNKRQLIDELREKIEDFHSACHDLQTLKIAEVVTLMANLFYYVEGVNEDVNQRKNDGCNSKLQCASLFHRE